MDEILETWKDTKNDGVGNKMDLLRHLKQYQFANTCQPLIYSLENAAGKFLSKILVVVHQNHYG